jgi:predicted transcriptional regulator
MVSDDDVKKIKELLAEKKLTHEQISYHFNVCRATITQINVGKRWSHIKINQ